MYAPSSSWCTNLTCYNAVSAAPCSLAAPTAAVAAPPYFSVRSLSPQTAVAAVSASSATNATPRVIIAKLISSIMSIDPRVRGGWAKRCAVMPQLRSSS